jgi:myo-inositol-1-phosphate synthase
MTPLGLVRLEQVVFGGCEIRHTQPYAAALELCAVGGFLQREHVEAAREVLDELGGRLDPGLVLDEGRTVSVLESNPYEFQADSAQECVAEIRRRFQEFAVEQALERIVVVNLASTEAYRESPAWYGDLQRFQEALETEPAGRFHPSVLYAYAAIDAGYAYLNFTPSPGSAIQALVEFAEQRGVAHMGRDGKTGETLLKTTLAPMFLARALRVLSWEGHNILGNRDGSVLDHPGAKRTKCESKGGALEAIMNDPELHSRVRIDYVPSLGDWKTAWDFIHFEGFLGTRMILQLIWQGCDSILAAPLVLDLVRLLDHAQRRGQSGVQPHLAGFFKSPTGVEIHAFSDQVRLLQEYIANEVAFVTSAVSNTAS